MKNIALLCVFLVGLGFGKAAKILFVQTIGKSHLNVFMPLMKELKVRKHDIHVITTPSMKPSFPADFGFQLIEVDRVEFDDKEMKDFMLGSINKDAVSKMIECTTFARVMNEPTLKSKSFHELMKKGKHYDLVVIDMLLQESIIAATRLIANHTMYLSTAGLFNGKNLNIPQPPSFVPDMMEHLTSKMDFFQRMRNAYLFVAVRYIFDKQVITEQQRILEKYIPAAPNILEAEKEVSFILTNSDPVIYSPRPSVPNIVHVGGMHCGKPDPLTKEFEEFATGSGDDGFIMFGLGSNVRSDLLPTKTMKAFMDAFSRLKTKVLWKFETGFNDTLPANVKLTKWMPQQALLAHSNIRLFITHGGLLSVQEAIYHGVPVIGVPVFAEQPGNVARIQELGIGEKLDLLNVTAEGVYQVVNKILNDKSYSTNMKRYSAIFRDQPQSPLERAVFWTEYVIRHNGAPHLKTAAEDLNFFQYFLLDVAAFVVVVLTACGLGLAFVGKLLLRKVCGKAKQKSA